MADTKKEKKNQTWRAHTNTHAHAQTFVQILMEVDIVHQHRILAMPIVLLQQCKLFVRERSRWELQVDQCGAHALCWDAAHVKPVKGLQGIEQADALLENGSLQATQQLAKKQRMSLAVDRLFHANGKIVFGNK